MSNELRYQVFEPVNDHNSNELVVVANVLGGVLESPGGKEGDLAYRAKHIADHTGALVLAYERRGSGRAILDLGAHRSVNTHHYAGNALHTAIQLDKAIDRINPSALTFAGASAGALDLISVTQAEVVKPDTLRVFDPVGVRDVGWLEGLRAWIDHQKAESAKSAELNNQHPMKPLGQPWSIAKIAQNTVGTALEMYRYGNVWRTPLATSGLVQILTEDRYGDIAVFGEFIGHSFNNIADGTNDLVEMLRSYVSNSDRQAPARLELNLEKYHSWTDDPVNFTSFVQYPDL